MERERVGREKKGREKAFEEDTVEAKKKENERKEKGRKREIESIAEECKATEEEKDRVSTLHCVMWRTTVRKGRWRNRHVGRISPVGGGGGGGG